MELELPGVELVLNFPILNGWIDARRFAVCRFLRETQLRCPIVAREVSEWISKIMPIRRDRGMGPEGGICCFIFNPRDLGRTIVNNSLLLEGLGGMVGRNVESTTKHIGRCRLGSRESKSYAILQTAMYTYLGLLHTRAARRTERWPWSGI
jgi:hypothetical protein